ncbi:MAG: transporter, partial [Burkholderiales bacterium]|nr:transporter [Burkholderiales bacterium]
MKSINLKLTLLAASAALMLVACNRNDASNDKTAGQKLDTAIAKVEQKTEDAKTEIKQDMAAAKESVSNAADKVASKAEDAAITTGVNAELAKDPALSALRID